MPRSQTKEPETGKSHTGVNRFYDEGNLRQTQTNKVRVDMCGVLNGLHRCQTPDSYIFDSADVPLLIQIIRLLARFWRKCLHAEEVNQPFNFGVLDFDTPGLGLGVYS